MATKIINIEDYEFEIFFQESAKKNGYLFFLHGYPDNYECWFPQIEYFKKDFGIIAPNIPGVGRSKKPSRRDHYNVKNIIPAFSKLIKKMVPDETIPIQAIGHDWGAMLLWSMVSHPHYAKQFKSFTAISGPHPRLAQKNLLNKITSGSKSDKDDFLEQFLKSWYIYLFQLPFVPELTWQNFSKPLWENMLRRADTPPNDPRWNLSEKEILERVINPLGLYREMLQGSSIPVPELIKIPIQLIIPENDMAISSKLYDNHYQYVPNLKVLHVESNHWVQIEKPDETNSHIESFIREYIG